ncbi:MAG: hypothetical protein KBS64_04085 [Treponema sp.]|nr:hypothetical protein [Candidatus Treponema equi]
MNKKLLSMIFTAGISLTAFAGTKFNEVDQAVIDRFWTYRMEATCIENDEETVQALDRYKEVHADEISQISEEAAILLDALILMERYNYIYVFPGEDKASRPPFEKMRKRIKKYLENKKDSEVTPYILLCNADITSYYMSYSITDIIFNGMSVKKYQEKAVEQGKNFSPAMLNLSTWYYYSPKIFGGSKEQTRKWLIKALENARIDAETFFAKLAYSQFLFEMKEYEESARQLDDAEKLCPGSRRVKLLREQNALGLSLNDYNKKRSKILKSADDYKKKNNIKE